MMSFEESINMDSYQNDGGVREVDFQVCSLKLFFSSKKTVRFTDSERNCGEQKAIFLFPLKVEEVWLLATSNPFPNICRYDCFIEHD